MPDREKVINELTEIYDEAYDRWVHRPYIEDKLVTLIRDDIPDALALLKEQEAVKPEFDSLDGNVGRWRCGNCHISIGAVRAPYCWHCGKAVKWG